MNGNYVNGVLQYQVNRGRSSELEKMVLIRRYWISAEFLHRGQSRFKCIHATCRLEEVIAAVL